jgi:hypothetical protein
VPESAGNAEVTSSIIKKIPNINFVLALPSQSTLLCWLSSDEGCLEKIAVGIRMARAKAIGPKKTEGSLKALISGIWVNIQVFKDPNGRLAPTRTTENAKYMVNATGIIVLFQIGTRSNKPTITGIVIHIAGMTKTCGKIYLGQKG